jgi:anti-sigma factor (TIGR02949 family)
MTEHNHCHQILEELSEYLDGSLSETLCAELERHMCECDDCQVVYNTMKKTIDLYRKASPGGDVPDDVRSRLYARLNLEDFLDRAEKHPQEG